MKYIILLVSLLFGASANSNTLALGPDAEANTTLIASALAAGGIVNLPAGEYPINNITFSNDFTAMQGVGMPAYNGTTLVGGTILTGGTLNMAQKRGITIKDLGVVALGVSFHPNGATCFRVNGATQTAVFTPFRTYDY